ncbi:hypothetical protein [Streptomyces sp. NPDC006691]|uniref:hypothetical protein n=1 Tax=Streptomyces sp. NPDC006691 TaxID=3364757 RepID=UPI003673D013
MRSLLRIAVAAATFLLVGMAVVPGAAHAVNGDERIAQMRLRVVDVVNKGTLSEIQRLRSATSGGLSEEVVRLEAKLHSGLQLAADLRSVRSPGAVHGRGAVAGAGTSAAPGAATGGGTALAPSSSATRAAAGAVVAGSGGAALMSTSVSSASAVSVVPSVGSVGSAGSSAGDSTSSSASDSASGSADGSSSGRGHGGDNAFEAARAALPDTPVGVLSLIAGGALALVGGGMAAAVVRRPYKKG